MPLTSSDSQPLNLRRRKRLKVDLACEICRRRKVKCDGARPACGNCLKRSDLQGQCAYTPIEAAYLAFEKIPSESGIGSDFIQQPKSDVSEQPQRLPNSTTCGQTLPLPVKPVHNQRSKASAFQSDPNITCADSTSQTLNVGGASRERFGSSSSVTFTGQIKAAIDARFGGGALPPSQGAVPLVDASLFPPVQDDAVVDSMASGMEYELPPRKHADHLVHIYWSFVDPLFPVLNKTSFMRSYGTLFSGIAVDTNERILVSTLNAVFALSIQLQESLKPNQRDRLSGKYFQRAHDLLRLRIWERGSIELVQCLLVMSQYLQCTDKPHQTWMVVGSAVRIAQSLGFHLPETWASPSNDQGAALSCRIWQACIAMDRTICVTHGRPTMISEALAATVIESKRRTCLLRNKDDQLPHEEFLAKAVELYEITNQTVHKFISSAHTRYYNADLSGIINPSQNEEKLAIIIQVDGCLCRWENSLPAHLKFENASRQPDDICRRQAIILHLRLLHARILLFRPMLARCCLVVEPDSLDGSLSDHIMQQCALSCVEAARNMISVLRQHQKHDGSIGMLPAWWYRVFYIYTAATILAVSTLRPDIFTHAETINSWEEALLLFQAHEHLSESVRVCLSALQIMFSKIQQTQDVSMSSLLFDGFPSEPQGAPVTECPDFIQNFPFGLDYSTLFNLDGMSSVISGQFPSQ